VVRKVLLASILVLLSVSPGARCGGDENEGRKLPPVKDVAPEDQSFHVNGEADRYSGPAPHKVQFAAEAYNASGDVRWVWLFDDGTTSTERNPRHTFRDPGYYLVQVEAMDENKHSAARGLYLGIWPAKVWAAAQRGEVNQPAEVRKQQIRTRRRKRRLRELCRRDPECRRSLEERARAAREAASR
jgi:PKD domain